MPFNDADDFQFKPTCPNLRLDEHHQASKLAGLCVALMWNKYLPFNIRKPQDIYISMTSSIYSLFMSALWISMNVYRSIETIAIESLINSWEIFVSAAISNRCQRLWASSVEFKKPSFKARLSLPLRSSNYIIKISRNDLNKFICAAILSCNCKLRKLFVWTGGIYSLQNYMESWKCIERMDGD